MRTLNISISDIEYDKYGIKTDQLSFAEIVDLISKDLSRQTLNDCNRLAEKFGLSKLTMEEITEEVKTVRQDAKNNN